MRVVPTVAHDDLPTSDVTGPWSMWARPICSKWLDEPDPCDCGHTGEWERRFVLVWCHQPGHHRPDRQIREDMAKGWPGRPRDEGWWVMDGWDERCPSCGDIERFDMEAIEGRRFRVQGVVIPFRRPAGERR